VLVHKHAPCAVIDLQVAASRFIQFFDECAIRCRDVLDQRVLVRIEFIRRFLVFRALQLRQELGRCRNRLPRYYSFLFELLNEFEVLNEWMVFTTDLTAHPRRFSTCRSTSVLKSTTDIPYLHPVETPHDIKVPPSTAELTVSTLAETHFLLFRNQIFQRCILH